VVQPSMEAAPIPVSHPGPHDRAKLSNLPRVRGMDLLDTPLLNKGTAFSYEERTRLGLHALLPPQVETLEQQVFRAYEAYERKTDDLERHIYLRALQDNNEVLFYRLLLDHLEEMTPVVYTPVVAAGCQEFSHIYRRPRGLFLSYPLRESLVELLRHRPNPEVDVIVVTDGERILGIGDQGAGGLGIPIGKLSLYTLFGGIAPERTLPIVLDVGTNNPDRLKDPEYLGWRHDRINGPDYYSFIDRFVQAVKQELPGTLLQWEDFGVAHARPILELYRDQMLTFNDDIQGTGAVALAVVLAAAEVTGIPFADQRVAILGAGSAGIGVSDLLRAAFVQSGLSDLEARRRCWIVNRGGLLHSERTDLKPEQRVYAQPWDDVRAWARANDGKIGLEEVVREAKPTVLVGLSTLKGAFTEAIVHSMARWVSRPLILPLSNPTAKSEALPEDLIRWTEGRAIIATGSPFPPVQYRDTKYEIAQCNNAYIFPGLGLGLVAGRCRRVTDAMLLAAAQALAQRSPAREDPHAPLLPSLRALRDVAQEIAMAVAQEGQRTELAPAMSVEEIRTRIRQTRWDPEYPIYA
jgi:malate dehydrogenase (oxaloacetate-decarboxylating)